jgi:hypothetical protein
MRPARIPIYGFLPLTEADSFLSLSVNAGNRTSRTSVVLPEPLTPVTHTNLPSGISTLRYLRLCRVAWVSLRVGQASCLSCRGNGASFKTSGSETGWRRRVAGGRRDACPN